MTTRMQIPEKKLQWSQPKWSVDRFELHAGGELLGELYWTKCMSDQAIARCSKSSWVLDRRGFFRDRVVVLKSDSQALAASFQFDWLMDGELLVANGRSFRWSRTKLLEPAWTLIDEAGTAIFEIQLRFMWFKHEATIRLWADQRTTPGLDLLLSMGMYLAMITMQDETVAVAAATTACI